MEGKVEISIKDLDVLREKAEAFDEITNKQVVFFDYWDGGVQNITIKLYSAHDDALNKAKEAAHNEFERILNKQQRGFKDIINANRTSIRKFNELPFWKRAFKKIESY